MKPLSRLALLAGFLGLSAHGAPTVSPPPEEKIDLKFGVYTTDKPTTVYRQFTDILDYLESDVEERLGISVSIEIVIHKSYDEALDSFTKGDVDFVRFGPASYVLAERTQPRVTLLAMELKGGAKTFDGHVIARTDSGIDTVEDLRGRRFAFGDQNSTIGRYLAQSELVGAEIFAKDLEDYDYLGRHDLVARGVLLGNYDAGSVKSSSFKKANKKKSGLKIIHTFKNTTKPWIARAGLDSTIARTLSQSLLELDDEDILASFKVSGFSEATANDYEYVRAGMEKAERYWGDTKLNDGPALPLEKTKDG